MNAIRCLAPALLGGLVCLGAQSALAAEAKIPLVSFYSASRGDYFTTSDPLWTCTYYKTCAGGPATAPPSSGYVVVGLQGHVWNPANPQPTGTRKLHHWFDPARGDNFVTTDPAWAGSVGATKDGYILFRVEGYIAASGWMPLESYWNPATADNATLATWNWASPAGYGFFRFEGSLLPPDDVGCTGAPDRVDDPSWMARGNYVETWDQPDFRHRDRVMFSAPEDWYRIDYWPDHWHPVRGYQWSVADASYPAPGRPAFALLARVTTGRVFTGNRWYEANQWFQALGSQQDFDGPCVYYDATGVTAGSLQTMFNDPNIGDNGGHANIKVKQWW